MKTILPDVIHGVMSISGYRGSGKSFLASQADLPQNIVFLDFESKGEGIDAQLNFGMYRPLNQEATSPIHLFNLFNNTIDSLPQGEYTTLILDNISPLEVAMATEAQNNAEHYAPRFGLNLKNIQANRFGGARSVVNFMISEFASRIHAKGIRLIINTAHIKPKWSPGGIIPNKFNVKGADSWQDLSILTLILVPGQSPPIPDALVQKEQLGTISISQDPTEQEIESMLAGNSGHTISRRLPPRIPECSFQKIRYYLTNPIDFNNLADDEKPRESEVDPFRDRLSKEQFAYVRASLEIKEREDREEEELLSAIEQQKKNEGLQTIAHLISEFSEQPDFVHAPPALQARLKEAGHDVDMGTVVRAMGIWKDRELKGE